jgi:catechol 2,3-dioxygenase-like lactoylglutathione lyase family enzyme
MTVTVAPLHLHHLALTVRDLDASVEWYEQVFGIRHQMDAPHPGGFARVLADDTWQLVIVLHRHDANSGELFRKSHTGLDHAGLAVPTRDDLVAWQTHLEAHRVVREEAADRPLTPVTHRGRALRLGTRVPRPGQHPARTLLTAPSQRVTESREGIAGCRAPERTVR